MDCERAMTENIAERYLNGTLSPTEKEEWEQHYFACEECAERLETLQAIQEPLREMAPQIRDEMRPRGASRPGQSRPWWVWAGAGIGAAAAAAVVAFLALPPAVKAPAPPLVPQRTVDYTLLARLDPPAYTPSAMRGGQTPAERAFREAMTAYQQRDWPRAIAGLTAALARDPGSAPAHFFLGASYLLNGTPREGIAELERVPADSPFADEARFDLAKGYLALGRVDDARAVLQKLAGGHGEFAAQAGALLERIQGAR